MAGHVHQGLTSVTKWSRLGIFASRQDSTSARIDIDNPRIFVADNCTTRVLQNGIDIQTDMFCRRILADEITAMNEDSIDFHRITRFRT